MKDAALHLGYTSSAVSQQLGALERETATVLVEPAGRGIRLTAVGVLLAQRAGELLDRAAEVEAEVRALQAGEAGVLRLAAFATAGAELVPRAMASVRSSLPGLEITLRVAEREHALAQLMRGVIDVAVVEAHDRADFDAASGLVVHSLVVDPFRLVMPRGHALAVGVGPVALGDAAQEPWIDLTCEVGCCRAATDTAYRAAGFSPRRMVQAEEYWPAQGFVAAGLGLALIPSLALGVQHRGVEVRTLRPADTPQRQIFAITTTTTGHNLPVDSILSALAEQARVFTTDPDM